MTRIAAVARAFVQVSWACCALACGSGSRLRGTELETSGVGAVAPIASSAPNPGTLERAPGERLRVTVFAEARARRELEEAFGDSPAVVLESAAPKRVVPPERLFDQADVLQEFARQAAGVQVLSEGASVRVQVRLAELAQGGNLGSSPPLTALRLATFTGLSSEQSAAMVRLVVATAVHVDKPLLARGRDLTEQLRAARSVLDDQRAQRDCSAPCASWSWQTRWSVLTSVGHAEWRQAAISTDRTFADDSVRHFRAALALLPQDGFPVTTAVTRRFLAAALHASSQFDDGKAALEAALAEEQAALGGFARALYPHDWAFTQFNIMQALDALGDRERNPKRYDEALLIAGRILEVHSRRAAPVPWARTRLAMARVSRSQGVLREDNTGLAAASQTVDEALSALSPATSPRAWIEAQELRCQFDILLGRLGRDPARFQTAVAACDAALEGTRAWRGSAFVARPIRVAKSCERTPGGDGGGSLKIRKRTLGI
jgi:hypothetical protein